MSDMRGELQQALSAMHAEAHREGMEREAAVEVMLIQVMQQMQHLEEESRRMPDFLSADIKPCLQELRNGESATMEGVRTLLNGVEERFSTDVSQVHGEILRVQKFVQEVEASFVST